MSSYCSDVADIKKTNDKWKSMIQAIHEGSYIHLVIDLALENKHFNNFIVHSNKQILVWWNYLRAFKEFAHNFLAKHALGHISLFLQLKLFSS